MTHETVHRILTALVVREVAGVAEHILEAIPLDIGADRLEIEAGDPHVAPDVVRGLQFQLGMGLGRRKGCASVEAVHVLRQRPDPVTGEFRGAEHQLRMAIEHTAQNHRHQVVLHLQMDVGQGPGIEREFRAQHPTLECRRAAPFESREQLLADRDVTQGGTVRCRENRPDRIHPRVRRGNSAGRLVSS